MFDNVTVESDVKTATIINMAIAVSFLGNPRLLVIMKKSGSFVPVADLQR
ncbi:MAG: hypothetical protein VW557_10525 [Rhodospirillaceae bacterium]